MSVDIAAMAFFSDMNLPETIGRGKHLGIADFLGGQN